MIISVAHAASEAASHGNHGVLQDPTFWAGVSFFVVVIGLYKFLRGGLKTFFGVRAEKIKNKINDARKLREDTQKLLAEFEKKLHGADEEADAIVRNAQDVATRLKKETKADLDKEISKKENQALLKIKKNQDQAIQEIRNHVADISMSVTEEILTQIIEGEKANSLVFDAIEELPERIKQTGLVA